MPAAAPAPTGQPVDWIPIDDTAAPAVTALLDFPEVDPL